jgi:hypothetical protein
VLDYQIRQTTRGVNVRVPLKRDTSLAGVREQLHTAFTRVGLADPVVTVDAVVALPRHPEPASHGG